LKSIAVKTQGKIGRSKFSKVCNPRFILFQSVSRST
jgi:hypothetical protein